MGEKVYMRAMLETDQDKRYKFKGVVVWVNSPQMTVSWPLVPTPTSRRR